jgi:hypothetical protein
MVEMQSTTPPGRSIVPPFCRRVNDEGFTDVIRQLEECASAVEATKKWMAGGLLAKCRNGGVGERDWWDWAMVGLKLREKPLSTDPHHPLVLYTM